jgi:hypothetical protein
MKVSDNQLKNIVSFCILMENDQGIISKSPDYILEKFNRYGFNQTDEFKWGLDDQNKIKLSKWIEKWLK